MKFTLENLGVIKKASIEPRNLTVVCGLNNNGKSYLTYAFYAFLKFLQKSFEVNLPKKYAETLDSKGMVSINLTDFIDKYRRINDVAVKEYVNSLQSELVLGTSVAKDGIHAACEFDENILSKRIIEREFPPRTFFRFSNNGKFYLKKKQGDGNIVIELPSYTSNLESGNSTESHSPLAVGVIHRGIQIFLRSFFSNIVGNVFIVSSERSGIMNFLGEFNIFRNIAFQDEQTYTTTLELRRRFEFKGYSLPIRDEMGYVLRLEEVCRSRGQLAEQHPEILQKFEEIVGGKYEYDMDTQNVRFIPFGSDVKLTIAESSSSVRSLAELYFYLKHTARFGQMLMIDEPEQNLHPRVQRKLAQLFAYLSKKGLRIFITTHSDYIIREINLLSRIGGLSNAAQEKARTATGYDSQLFLSANDISVYMLVGGTTVPVDAKEEYGFAISSFDDTISEFNSLFEKVEEVTDAE